MKLNNFDIKEFCRRENSIQEATHVHQGEMFRLRRLYGVPPFCILNDKFEWCYPDGRLYVKEEEETYENPA